MPFEILDEKNVALADLVEDPKNVNIHPERNLEAIAASLRRWGQPERLIVRKSDGIVFSGNGRLEAMRRLNLPKARVQYVEGSDDECRGYAVAANRTARLSEFNEEELGELLQELKAKDPTLLAAAGFNDAELAAIVAETEDDGKEAPEPDLDVSKSSPAVVCPQCHHTFRVGGA